MRVVDIEPHQVLVSPRQERPLGDIAGLMASIETVGLLHPIVIGTDGQLKAGYRRLQAFRQLGRDTIPAHIAENLDDVIQALKAERDENTQREDLPPTVMVERGRELQEAEREAARKRQAELNRPAASAKFAEAATGNTRDKVGEALGVSGETWRKAEAVVSAAEADPETFGDLPEKMDETSVHAAYQEMKQRTSAPHVTHNSRNNEWCTPAEFVEAARQTMQAIDLDPASSEAANETVKATAYYTADTDGLGHEWSGRVWMNPPYSSDLVAPFCEKLLLHVSRGDVSEACVLVNNATETAWFQALLSASACVCFPRSRIKFQDEHGNTAGTPLQGQAIVYIGACSADFETAFGDFGTILFTRSTDERLPF